MSGQRWAKLPLVLGAGDDLTVARIERPVRAAFDGLLALDEAEGVAGGVDSPAETAYAMGLVDALRWVRTGTIAPQMLEFIEAGGGHLTEGEVHRP